MPRMIRRTYSIPEYELPLAVQKAKNRNKKLGTLVRDYLVNLPLYPVSRESKPASPLPPTENA